MFEKPRNSFGARVNVTLKLFCVEIGGAAGLSLHYGLRCDWLRISLPWLHF